MSDAHVSVETDASVADVEDYPPGYRQFCFFKRLDAGDDSSVSRSPYPPPPSPAPPTP